MRGKIAFAVVAVACLAAAGLYYSPTTLAWVQQLISGKQADASDKTASGDKTAGAPDNAKGDNAKGGGPRSASIVSAVATTADFPIRRYAIGFVSSPEVVNINARVSSQIVSIAVKDGQMVKAGDLLISLDDRALKAQLAKDQATLAKDQAMLV
ncbi:MAG: biotin/lipoyl-binding protein, partial [Mesorhizobium sp.]